jgi:hypothetical protein
MVAGCETHRGLQTDPLDNRLFCYDDAANHNLFGGGCQVRTSLSLLVDSSLFRLKTQG